jgi:hypothetical protein
VDELAFLVGFGEETRVEAGDEGVVMGAVFGADDFGFGVDAGFEGVLGGDGAATGGSRATGFLRVYAIGDRR